MSAISQIGNGAIVCLEPDLLRAVAANRRAVRAALTAGVAAVYGVNTGVGRFAGHRVDPRAQAEQQHRLLAGRAVGGAPWLPAGDTRVVMAIKLRTLLAPESGVLLGDTPESCVEVPFQLVAALAPTDLLGPVVHELFGTSFPIRFDYLDTVGGGNLSVHCHPRPDQMRQVFGWPYTQHESYYLMRAGEHSRVFLGLRAGADLAAFHRDAHAADAHGVAFDIGRYVQTFPARAGQLYLVPAGTPHGSGEGNVVLEVSATPYLYSLRFYDWLRRDAADRQRKVHVEHAFRNLDPARSGDAVGRDLVQRPRTLTAGDGWRLELIGALPDMFFQVHRLAIGPGATAGQRTDGRFHVLTVVDGTGVLVTTGAGRTHRLSYAETLAMPASAESYRVHNDGPDPVRVVKAQVT